ncbi:DUF4391 domain-containing protein [Paenibacillus sp. KR2-11]|uniref:DUF4391 domain-containing protein n=1 Tax=Paenibacillus sp. KR2-11 TaxID=3385500 RepID=UPI0038FCAE1C
MNVTDIITSLELPVSALVDQRVPKRLLLENGAITASDKRLINDGIQEINWIAAIKPTTVGVPEYRDDGREYLEIAILSLTLRSQAKTGRIAELVHRAIPYPVWLLILQEEQVTISLAHKRWAQNEINKVVLEGEVVELGIESHLKPEAKRGFLQALSLMNQRRTNLMVLYQGWIDTLLALQAAHLTGVFVQVNTTEHAALRREALAQYNHLSRQIATLRSQAIREHQINRRVELNVEIKRLEKKLDEALTNI